MEDLSKRKSLILTLIADAFGVGGREGERPREYISTGVIKASAGRELGILKSNSEALSWREL